MNTPARRTLTREEAAAQLAHGTWDGTLDLLTALAYESMHAFGWRPRRAAILYAEQDIGAAEDRVFMSGPEFAAWRTDAKALAKARGHDRDVAGAVLGLSAFQARSLSEKGASKAVALACAHYLFGLELPIAAEDPRLFEEWYRPRFGGTERVADWLQVNPNWLSARLRGFEVIKDERVERLPPAYLIRACDWLWRVGPFCPYGDRKAIPLWTGHDVTGLTR
jgi:hypothetical protein